MTEYYLYKTLSYVSYCVPSVHLRVYVRRSHFGGTPISTHIRTISCYNKFDAGRRISVFDEVRVPSGVWVRVPPVPFIGAVAELADALFRLHAFPASYNHLAICLIAPFIRNLINSLTMPLKSIISCY